MDNREDLPSLDALRSKISDARRGKEETAYSGGGRAKAGAMTGLSELIAGVGVGGFIGYYLDQWLDTRPAMIILFIFLGLAGGVMNLYRAALRDSTSQGSHDDNAGV